MTARKCVKRASYSIREVAEAHGLHRSTIWRWIRAGQLKVVRLPGRNARIPAAEFDRLGDAS